MSARGFSTLLFLTALAVLAAGFISGVAIMANAPDWFRDPANLRRYYTWGGTAAIIGGVLTSLLFFALATALESLADLRERTDGLADQLRSLQPAPPGAEAEDANPWRLSARGWERVDRA